MNYLTVAVFACLAVFAYAKPSGHWDDGNWGGHGGWVVAHHEGDGEGHNDGHDDGHWDNGHDDGHWDDGHDDGHWDNGHDDGHGHEHWGPHANVVKGNHATLVGPGHGHGWAGDGHGASGHGHGLVVRGPHTVPVKIVGPAGKVVADGLWGPTHAHGHGGHGHGHGW